MSTELSHVPTQAQTGQRNSTSKEREALTNFQHYADSLFRGTQPRTGGRKTSHGNRAEGLQSSSATGSRVFIASRIQNRAKSSLNRLPRNVNAERMYDFIQLYYGPESQSTRDKRQESDNYNQTYTSKQLNQTSYKSNEAWSSQAKSTSIFVVDRSVLDSKHARKPLIVSEIKPKSPKQTESVQVLATSID